MQKAKGENYNQCPITRKLGVVIALENYKNVLFVSYNNS